MKRNYLFMIVLERKMQGMHHKVQYINTGVLWEIYSMLGITSEVYGNARMIHLN